MSRFKNLIFTFSKAQTAASIATLIDFLIYIIVSQSTDIFYSIAAFFGAATGGIVGFLLGRYWAFESSHHPSGKQIYRYIQVWFLSAVLNSLIVLILADIFDYPNIIVKIAASIFVGFFINYPLHCYYVFNNLKP